MWRPNLNPRMWRWFLISAAAVIVGLVVFLVWPQSKLTTTTNTDRDRYAALYDAAWRQDDGTQPTLMTATLLVPPAITLLGNDDGRSSAENQIWSTVQALQSNQLAIVLTIDSVDGAVSDDVITSSVKLQSADSTAFSLNSWTPIIAPTNVVNSANASSQIGVLVFNANATLIWSQLKTLTLSVNAFDGQTARTFTWSNPPLLLEAQ